MQIVIPFERGRRDRLRPMDWDPVDVSVRDLTVAGIERSIRARAGASSLTALTPCKPAKSFSVVIPGPVAAACHISWPRNISIP